MINLYIQNHKFTFRTSTNFHGELEEYKYIWIDIENPSEEDIIQLNKRFDLHNLALEHLNNGVKGTKFISYTDYSFYILSSVNYNISNKNLSFKPVYLFVSNNYIITIRYEQNHLITKLRSAIVEDNNMLRKGTDFILYYIMNEIVKEYFFIADKIEEQIENIQDKIMDASDKETLNEVMVLKRKVLKLRKKIYPLREIISNISRNKYSFINEENKLYFLDVLDHLLLVNDMLESNKDMLITSLELYSSQLSNKTNDVMRFLTVITTIMMPITIISGVYGMNFKFMPELGYKYSYLIFWIVVTIFIVIQLIIFRKKKWL